MKKNIPTPDVYKNKKRGNSFFQCRDNEFG